MDITVIGAAGIDLFIKSKRQIVTGQSNLADVSLRASGQARDISSMLVRRGAKVSLITAVGDDPLGALLKDSCEGIGINTDAWIIKGNVCTYVNSEVHDNDGKLHAGFDATSAPETIKTSDITKRKSLIENADLLILELNLTEKILAAALEARGGKPVLVDAVSEKKALRIENFIDKIDVLKLDRKQAESLTGITLDNKERVKFACYSLVDKGARRVFITLGVAGACASDEHSTIFVPAQPVAVRDVSGAGTAFVSGLAMGMDLDLRSQAERGVTYAREHLSMFVKG